MRIYGIDFTCAPRRAKPITIAVGDLKQKALRILEILELEDFAGFEAFLARPGPWLGGFDFPFSLPRELIRDLRWPASWEALVRHCSGFSRREFRDALDAYRRTRPVGSKYVHRATDHPAGSSSPMKLVNPPVALMFHEGARRLAAADVHIPALRERNSFRVALEAYPGLLVRRQLGIRDSYKSDARREQTAARRAVRTTIVEALQAGRPLGVGVLLEKPLQKQIISDGSGDLLDAVICATQGAWAWRRRSANYGLPRAIDPVEGWIVTS